MATGKLLYGTPANFTISLGGLATSATWVAGQQSDVVSNITDENIDELISGQIMVGTTPTASTVINVYVFAQTDDTPTYPSVGSTTLLGASDAAATFTSAEARQNAVRLGANIFVPAATSNVPYPIPPFSVASLFGGIMPRRYGVFVAHNCGAALHATGGNHIIQRTPIQYEIV